MEKSYDCYPATTILMSNLLSFSIYAIGAYLLYVAHPYLAALYVLIILFLEYRLLSGHCVNCAYYGKFCSFGKGKLCSLFFKRGDPTKFASMNLTFKDLLPEMLATLVLPLLAGAYLLVTSFSWLVVVLMGLLLILSSAGNAAVRGNLACKFCKQRQLGCPAEKLFAKKSG